MPFAPGDDVLVTNLGKGIVREVRRHGQYVAEVKGRTLIVPESRVSRLDLFSPLFPNCERTRLGAVPGIERANRFARPAKVIRAAGGGR